MLRLRKAGAKPTGSTKLAELGSVCLVAVIYLSFVCVATSYFRNRARYDGVESWPSVPVDEIRVAGARDHYRMGSRFGPETSVQIDAQHVEYRYTVGGTSYPGSRVTPSSQNPIGLRPAADIEAFYDPENPEVAVLIPIKYRSDAHLVGIGFLGMLVAGHLYFSLRRG